MHGLGGAGGTWSSPIAHGRVRASNSLQSCSTHTVRSVTVTVIIKGSRVRSTVSFSLSPTTYDNVTFKVTYSCTVYSSDIHSPTGERIKNGYAQQPTPFTHCSHVFIPQMTCTLRAACVAAVCSSGQMQTACCPFLRLQPRQAQIAALTSIQHARRGSHTVCSGGNSAGLKSKGPS